MNNVIKSGFLLINKPTGISSYGCINHIKRILRQKNQGPHSENRGPHAKNSGAGSKEWGYKIGHAGTLDPFASGLLIVALGREATRLIARFMVMEKTYIATGKCGELTDTLDYTGTVMATTDVIPSEQEIKEALDSFGSSYEQIPPLYSALKHQGKPLYLLARKKMINQEQLQEISTAKRRIVQLYEKQFLSYDFPFFTIQVRVSHGTYIRTLINDIAVRAGSYATTYQLIRTAIGPFSLSDAVNLSSLNTIDDVNAHIIPFDMIVL